MSTPDNLDDLPPDEPAPITRPVRPAREMPASEEAETSLLGTCLIDDGATLTRAMAEGITARSFYWPANQIIFNYLAALADNGQPISIETLTAELMQARKLSEIGGPQKLLSFPQSTTAHAGYFIEKVRTLSILRESIKAATRTVEEAYSFTGDIDGFLESAQARISGLAPVPSHPTTPRAPSSFQIPADNDRSILLGNRYLNRGDGLVLSSSSGIGKSSMQMQMAADWALGIPFFGIRSNGDIKSLIVQSEDSDGDIGEVWQSLKHVKNWTPEQCAKIDKNVVIVSERSLRGIKFIAWLRQQVALHKPDLVWLNPLQAFIDGDVTESRDLGAFLREGLNGINRAGEFGYVIVHHTTKPATGKDRAERQWHEVMYDMAGGAEIINWARGIISIRATPQPGKFRAVLAKRGRRAGVVKAVDAGAGVRMETVTEFGMQHASGFIPGTKTAIIHWEPCETEDIPQEDSSKSGRPEKYQFSDFASVFPKKESNGLPLNELHRAMESNCPIKKTTLHNVLKRWEESGDIDVIRIHGQPMRYRAAL